MNTNKIRVALVTIILTFLVPTSSHAGFECEIQTIYTVKDQAFYSALQEADLNLWDVDRTILLIGDLFEQIILTESFPSPRLRTLLNKYPIQWPNNFLACAHTIIHQKAQVKLIESSTPQLIHEFLAKTIALTNIVIGALDHKGSSYNIKTREKDLVSIGIRLHPHQDLIPPGLTLEQQPHADDPKELRQPMIVNGIVMTDRAEKGPIVADILRKTLLQQGGRNCITVTFIDDNEIYIESVRKSIEQFSYRHSDIDFNFYGFIYRGADNFLSASGDENNAIRRLVHLSQHMQFNPQDKTVSGEWLPADDPRVQQIVLPSTTPAQIPDTNFQTSLASLTKRSSRARSRSCSGCCAPLGRLCHWCYLKLCR